MIAYALHACCNSSPHPVTLVPQQAQFLLCEGSSHSLHHEPGPPSVPCRPQSMRQLPQMCRDQEAPRSAPPHAPAVWPCPPRAGECAIVHAPTCARLVTQLHPSAAFLSGYHVSLCCINVSDCIVCASFVAFMSDCIVCVSFTGAWAPPRRVPLTGTCVYLSQECTSHRRVPLTGTSLRSVPLTGASAPPPDEPIAPLPCRAPPPRGA